MAEHRPKQRRPLRVTTLGKAYEELPFGPKIMVLHPARAWCPPTDVFECANLYVIKCAISGLHCDPEGRIQGATVSVQGNTIIIRGQRHDTCIVARCLAHQMEIHYGAFQCQVEISDPFNADHVSVEYEDGFLRVTVPKKARRGPVRS